MTLDPKWLEIFKLELEHTFSGALACALFLAANHWGWVPPLAPWMIQLAWFGLLLFGCLWGVGLVLAVLRSYLRIRA
jgi:hypothetical protein